MQPTHLNMINTSKYCLPLTNGLKTQQELVVAKVPNQVFLPPNTNTEWMEQSELAAWINDNKNKIGKI